MTELNKDIEPEPSTDTAIDYSTCYAPLSHGSLFSGIGGFDLASEWMGWENLFHCEWNDFRKQVLQYYWPKATSYDDITKTDFTIWRGKIDVLTGGFPCQPYSVAGKRKGTEDDRHLWPEMLRAIRDIQPSWVVGENVSGLINWNGGLVFDEVQTDLENEGYEVWANVLPAASVNAPHKRDRVWFVAYSDHNRNSGRTRENESKSKKERLQERNQIQFANKSDSLRESPSYAKSERAGKLRNESETQRTQNSNELSRKQYRVSNEDVTHATCFGLRNESNGFGKSGFLNKKSKADDWQNFPTQSPVCDGDDGLSSRLDGITFPKWRNESIKAGGNAIVPQVAFQIFKAINEFRSSGA